MAGVIPKKSTSGRKQWTIHGAHRSSLKRLRSQMASDGCVESQVVLAKQLLEEECEFKSEQKENARSGVYWLLKASEQGNLEATDLLRTCLKTGKGISEHNYIDVKDCISMTQDEKIVRRAAKEVFARLSNGGEYITSNQLEKKILAIDRGETVKPSDLPPEESNGELSNNFDDSSESECEVEEDEVDWSQRSDDNEKLTEDQLVLAAVSFSHGELPAVNHKLCLNEPNLRALDNIPFVYWSILCPWLSIKIIYFKLMKYLGNKSIPLPLAKSETQLLLLFLAYSLTSISDVTYFVPTVIFYVSFIVMVVSTFQVLETQRELHDFRLWRGLFITYSNGDLNEHSFETQFILSHTKQYAWFFFGLLSHYLMYSITPVKLETEFAALACCLMFMTLLGFMPKRQSKTVLEPLVLLSFAINVLARYPYETDPIVSHGWRYLELNMPSFPSYVVGNGIEFCISFRLVLYALIPVILVRIAMKDKWRGSYRVVLPHLVTLSWLQYFALCSHNATMYGLYRATLALVGMFLFLPLMGIMSVILPVLAVTKWIVTSNLFYTISLFICLLAICLAVCFICSKTRYAKYTAAVQVILMLMAFFALLKTSDRTAFEMDNEPNKALEWDLFQKLCHQKAWEGVETVAAAQTRCAELEHVQVFWEGTVNSVRLVSIDNKYKRLIDHFPKTIADYLYCIYGQRHEDAVLQESSPNRCSLKQHNVHTYEATLKMSSVFWRLNPEVHLQLSEVFKNFTLRLQPKDSVWFKGTLYNNHTLGGNGFLGSFNTYVRAEEIGCITCVDLELASVKADDHGGWLLRLWQRLLKFVVNVLFNPVVIFK